MPPKLPRIAVLRPFPPAVLGQLSAIGELIVPPGGKILGGAEATAHVREAEALLVSPQDRVNAEMIEGAPALRVISSVSSGLDHIDLEACRLRRIEVANAPDATTEPTADMAFALILAAARRLTAADRWVRDGKWAGATQPFWGLDVHHRTLGVIGYGRIGQAIGRRAEAFSMKLLYHNRNRLPAEAEGRAEWRELDSLLIAADFVVLQTPLTEQSRGMIGARELSLMKPTAIVVNTGRGGLVDEAALATALTAGVIAGAALDVFANEPTPTPELLKAPNLILAPHIGTATLASREEMADQAVANLKSLLRSLF